MNYDLEFKIIKGGSRISSNGMIYTNEDYDKITDHFEDTQEYEKCEIVLNERLKILRHNDRYLKYYNIV